MTKTLVKAPFRADHVGSLLRPERIHQARKDFQAGNITASELYKIETEEIKQSVDKQIEVGLQAVTDGEIRRRFWHTDFMEHLNGVEGYVPESGFAFKGEETERYDVRVVGKVSFNPEHPHLKDFSLFKEIVGDRAIAKQTIPSPNQFFNAGIRNLEIYPDIEEYANDIIQTYRDAIRAFYNAGCRYLQLDDVYIAGLNAPEIPFNDSGYSREKLIDLALRVANGVLEDKPEDLTVTTHLCRGNYRSKWAFEGSYAKIAPTLFANEKVDGFFLEYDDDRSGDFQPLAYIPNDGPRVVLGVFTSKHGELEDKENIIARVKEASQYVPLENLCISPQCGFASTHHGNILTEEEQWAKLKYIVDISKEIWG
ncbi:5-methyltetrahydropteroyltriglutamate--homocysteine S-methyltransferase [Oceanobacillus caeni]|uniref:5-methyltetrahydropteroyltriglutamate--homocysteine methyltransferase n=1 Tax=Oceanobacillus caeni TaxID=405946 RepID=A0ABR5MMU9_9BACI|nr:MULTISPECIES: 5-methyltetrahydropteroyltriglutamate--homocysteine S-methyltransferase [Bacillaceae]PZD89171.1 5-methyltetrahydropteroyltriglutamate--homocysteine S-methyltransferase [Bacilli bacterium]KPH78213.1 5-methyltetrahydropteroyltriglutamate--homocysteine methyltransferase [Oceanobacillus caeni]MBU8791102.1 5-methyltetrahydropteroyltriglutamate--homocysteine S-methyltransferase [Oceanobacillus caeni]MCR1834808.1 5-methyltetrahydropteroyltriglutamate--homocysteine S-methyltransferase 